MAFQLLQNQASGHIKVKKGSGHVFYVATPSHTNESVCNMTIEIVPHPLLSAEWFCTQVSPPDHADGVELDGDLKANSNSKKHSLTQHSKPPGNTRQNDNKTEIKFTYNMQRKFGQKWTQG